MFTGIIEEIGTVASVKKGPQSARIKIAAQKILTDIHMGDSINTNGACLTVSRFDANSFEVEVMHESLDRTNLGQLQPGSKVNLERALQLSDRLGGHMVSGHVDGEGSILSIQKDDNAYWFTISAAPDILKYIVPKGSVALDGISLTVVSTMPGSFKVSIIPHTAAETTLLLKKTGELLNIECDLIGKYIERFIHPEAEERSGNIDINFLSKHGFTSK